MGTEKLGTSLTDVGIEDFEPTRVLTSSAKGIIMLKALALVVLMQVLAPTQELAPGT